MYLRANIALLLVFLSFMACGEIETTSAEQSSKSNSGVKLTFHGGTLNAYVAGKNGSFLYPQSDERFAILDITLENLNASYLVSSSFAGFALIDDAGRAYMGSAVTALIDKGCAADVALAEGGEIRCSLVFEFPDSALAKKLRYFINVEGNLDVAIPDSALIQGTDLPYAHCEEYLATDFEAVDSDCFTDCSWGEDCNTDDTETYRLCEDYWGDVAEDDFCDFMREQASTECLVAIEQSSLCRMTCANRCME